MSARPEMTYRCDRCGKEDTLPMENTPGHARAAGPSDWLVLGIGFKPDTPPSHLCTECKVRFLNFMEGINILT